MHRFRILAIAGALVLLSHYVDAAPSKPADAPPKVVARATLPPWWGDVVLTSARCPHEPRAQIVIAENNQEGPIHGCWMRVLGVILVQWADGDPTVFRETDFFKEAL